MIGGIAHSIAERDVPGSIKLVPQFVCSSLLSVLSYRINLNMSTSIFPHLLNTLTHLMRSLCGCKNLSFYFHLFRFQLSVPPSYSF